MTAVITDAIKYSTGTGAAATTISPTTDYLTGIVGAASKRITPRVLETSLGGFRIAQQLRIGIVGDSLLAPTNYTNYGVGAISRIPTSWVADNQAVGGAQSSALVAQINALNPNCNTVIMMEGVNDANASVSVTTHMTNITEACNAAIVRGMRPIVIAASPRDHATNSFCILYALAERYYCETNGIQFFDPWSRYIDTDGTWLTAVTSDGDHPLPAIHQQIGVDLASLITTNNTGYQLPRDNAGTGLIGNVLQLSGPNGVGLPDQFSRFDLPAGPYTVTDWAYPGRGKKYTINLSQTLTAEIYTSVSSGWVVGDRIRCTGMVTLASMSNAVFHAYIRPNGSAANDTNLCTVNTNQTDLFICGELVVPTGTTSLQLWLDVYSQVGGAYTCNLSFGALDLYKVT